MWILKAQTSSGWCGIVEAPVRYFDYSTENNCPIQIAKCPFMLGLANSGLRAKSDCCLFLDGLGAKHCFYIVKWLK